QQWMCAVVWRCRQSFFETQCDKCGKSTSPGHSTAAVRHFPPERQGAWRARHWTALQTGCASRLSGELPERSHRSVTIEWRLAGLVLANPKQPSGGRGMFKGSRKSECYRKSELKDSPPHYPRPFPQPIWQVERYASLKRHSREHIVVVPWALLYA